MDSPVRIQLKKNDYLRHKFFRTLNRRKKRLLLQLIEAPEKELCRRLRLKRYEGGKSPMDYEYRGTIYDDELKNQGVTHVAELPEVVVKGRDYTKPYESAFEYDPNFAKELPYFLPVVGDALDVADVAKDVYNGNYLSAGIGAGMLALPNFIEQPFRWVKGSFRKLRKYYKRLSEEHTYHLRDNLAEEYNDVMRDRADKFAKQQSKVLVKPSEKEKSEFMRSYTNKLYRDGIIEQINHHDYDRYSYPVHDVLKLRSMFQHNPEYFVHVVDQNITDPLSLKSIDSFINRQLTSIRGVTAPDAETAKTYLTETVGGRRLRGGDRLQTRGGLYVSNNPVIGDRFKNPVGNTTDNGYVGILKEPDTIDRTQPIELLLKQLRDRSEVTGMSEPLYGTVHMGNLDTSGAKFLEDRYVGNASRGTGGYERAYLPSKNFGEVEHPVLLKSLREYKNVKDQHGRFMLSAEATTDPLFFIAKQLNAYDDFIKRARAILTPGIDIDWDKYNRIYDQQMSVANARIKLRDELIRNKNSAMSNYVNLKETAKGLLPIGGLVGGLFGAGALIRLRENAKEEKRDEYLRNGLLRRGSHEQDEPTFVLTEKGKSANDERLLEIAKEYEELHDAWKNRYADRDNNYTNGKDSGIHIKPENRGKFNALKKRTGKTTEELTHSKNPLTRKRAIFALNARKWNHKK